MKMMKISEKAKRKKSSFVMTNFLEKVLIFLSLWLMKAESRIIYINMSSPSINADGTQAHPYPNLNIAFQDFMNDDEVTILGNFYIKETFNLSGRNVTIRFCLRLRKKRNLIFLTHWRFQGLENSFSLREYGGFLLQNSTLRIKNFNISIEENFLINSAFKLISNSTLYFEVKKKNLDNLIRCWSFSLQ